MEYMTSESRREEKGQLEGYKKVESSIENATKLRHYMIMSPSCIRGINQNSIATYEKRFLRGEGIYT